ncbi:hypothetical protein HYU18_04510 [Candidatus Woesearchaeota archaeon]|nr:hypothetical protein [Candidatus Woesearchaeota archaeon]
MFDFGSASNIAIAVGFIFVFVFFIRLISYVSSRNAEYGTARERQVEARTGMGGAGLQAGCRRGRQGAGDGVSGRAASAKNCLILKMLSMCAYVRPDKVSQEIVFCL